MKWSCFALVLVVLFCLWVLCFSQEEPTQEEGKFFPKLLSHIFDILSFRKVVAELKVGKTSPTMCFVCKFGVALLQHFVETDKPKEEIADIAYTVCSTLKLDSDRVCRGIVDLFKDEMMYIFQRTPLGPQEVCGVLMGNECAKITSPLHNWTVALPPAKAPKNVAKHQHRGGEEGVLRVLHLSDTHLDPHYLEGSDADCKELMCCRDGPAPSPERAAGPWGDYRNCDTPPKTLNHMLRHIGQNHKIDYVLWTGDIPPHDVWNTTREEQVRLLHGATRTLEALLPPGTRVFPALGNHESARINSFPQPEVRNRFSIEWLHEEVTRAWGRWLPKDALRTLRKGMYYAVKVRPGLRLISLNMNYCNSQNWWMLLNSTDPGQELTWLVKQLSEAEARGDKVHIIGHIPPGHSDCLPVWSANYYRIVNRFESTVRAQFFGHSHLDEFELFYEDEKEEGGAGRRRATNVAYVGPSVTTYDGVNPSYRIYTVDAKGDKGVLDHETYYMNLTEANGGSKGPVWRRSYSAREEYGLDSLEPEQWSRLVDRMQDDDTLFQKFVRHLYHLSDFPREECTGECKQETLCRLRSARSHDSSLCANALW